MAKISGPNNSLPDTEITDGFELRPNRRSLTNAPVVKHVPSVTGLTLKSELGFSRGPRLNTVSKPIPSIIRPLGSWPEDCPQNQDDDLDGWNFVHNKKPVQNIHTQMIRSRCDTVSHGTGLLAATRLHEYITFRHDPFIGPDFDNDDMYHDDMYQIYREEEHYKILYEEYLIEKEEEKKLAYRMDIRNLHADQAELEPGRYDDTVDLRIDMRKEGSTEWFDKF